MCNAYGDQPTRDQSEDRKQSKFIVVYVDDPAKTRWALLRTKDARVMEGEYPNAWQAKRAADRLSGELPLYQVAKLPNGSFIALKYEDGVYYIAGAGAGYNTWGREWAWREYALDYLERDASGQKDLVWFPAGKDERSITVTWLALRKQFDLQRYLTPYEYYYTAAEADSRGLVQFY